MSYKSLGNPFDKDTDLQHGPTCNCPICVFERNEAAYGSYECTESERTERLERAVFEGDISKAEASDQNYDQLAEPERTPPHNHN